MKERVKRVYSVKIAYMGVLRALYMPEAGGRKRPTLQPKILLLQNCLLPAVDLLFIQLGSGSLAALYQIF